MRTSIAAQYGYRCPRCGGETTRDPSGKGFVRHKKNRNGSFWNCPYGWGEGDLALTRLIPFSPLPETQHEK